MLTQVAEGVHVHQSDLLRNNTVVVQGDAGVLLVDAGIIEGEMSCLADDLRELGQPVVAGFSTHPDWDHVLWYAGLGDAPRYGTARCAELMAELRSQPDWQSKAAEGLPPEIADEVPLDLFGLVTALSSGTTYLPWDGPAVGVVEHPAHSPGHAALLVEGPGVLAAGDMLSDVFVPMLDNHRGDNDPVAEYLAGLEMLAELADQVAVLVPGHGSPCGADELRTRLDRDLAYARALRDDGAFDDPRIGDAVPPGWEWVNDIHEGQLQSVRAHRGAGGRT